MYGSDSDPDFGTNDFDQNSGVVKITAGATARAGAAAVAPAVAVAKGGASAANVVATAGDDAGPMSGTTDYFAIAVVEAAAAEERHVDAGGVAASAEAHNAIVGATAKALAKGSLPQFVRNATSKLMQGLGIATTSRAAPAPAPGVSTGDLTTDSLTGERTEQLLKDAF
jgi:hypothetical protein